MKKALAAVGAFALIVPIACVMFLASTIGTVANLLNPLCMAQGLVLNPTIQIVGGVVDGVEAVGDLVFGDDGLDVVLDQLENAATIYQVGKATPGVTDDDIVLALMTALQESNLINHGHLGERNDHNSIGLFQQQYGMVQNGVEYWGTAAQLHNPVYASTRFYTELLKYPDRASRPKTLAIQDVQRSAYPNAYAKWEDEAVDMFELFEANNPEPVLETDKSVAVIGDSITVMANSYMFDDLAAAGYSVIRIDAQGARSVSIDTRDTRVPTTSQTGPTLKESDEVLVSGLTAIRQQRQAGFDPQDWIILLGTNDVGLISSDPTQGAADVRELVGNVMDELGPGKRALWLTVWNDKQPEKTAVFNQTLAAIATERDDMLVGDWASLVEQHPDWLVDHVHYNPEGSKQRSSFIGKALGLMGDIGSLGSKVISATPILGGLMNGCNFQDNPLGDLGAAVTGALSSPVDGNTPLDMVSNPRLAQVAANFEQLVGADIKYGAHRSEWLSIGRKGNFGHGDKEQWLSELKLGSGYNAVDCSGLMNMIVYLAYGIDYSGCSHSYINATVNGQTVTVPVMENQLVASRLRPGDFINKHNDGCTSRTKGIGHIVIVLGVSGSTILTAESHAGVNDGYEIRERDVSWYNQEWPDLVVSRWIGPGAVVVEDVPVEIGAEGG